MTARSKTPVVEVRNLMRKYPSRPRPAVDGLSFTVGEGEVLGLVGPSGCGKSTTLRMIAGLEPLDAGFVHIGGIDASRTKPERRGVGWVPQSYGLFPHMSVAANVGYGLVGQGKSKEVRLAAVRDALALTQVSDLADYYPRQLSGGQRQRIALARALAIDPKVLLLDEPLAALDPQLRDMLRLELSDILRHSGRATIMVTHDQSEALALADKIAVLRDGVLLQCASPAEIWRSPADAFVAAFVARASMLHGVVRSDGGVELDGGFILPSEDLDFVQTDVAAGKYVDVVLRPRDVVVADSSGEVGVVVQVLQCEYLGNCTRVLGKLGDLKVTLELPSDEQIGAHVRIRGRRGSISVREAQIMKQPPIDVAHDAHEPIALGAIL